MFDILRITIGLVLQSSATILGLGFFFTFYLKSHVKHKDHSVGVLLVCVQLRENIRLINI